MEKIETENKDLKLKLIADFQKMKRNFNGEAGSTFNKIREEAIDNFSEVGFPEKKHEEWKYTNLYPILKHNYINAIGEYKSDLQKSDLKDYLFPGKNNLLVFVNGKFDSGLSEIVTGISENIFIGSFHNGRKKFGDVIEKHFSKYADYKNNGLTALNTAFAEDGTFIYVKKNTEVTETVHILNISDAKNENYFSQPRNLFVIEQGSRIKIAEDYLTIGVNYCFTNAVTEIYCGENSDVEYYKIQNDGGNVFHIGTTQVMQEKYSKFSNTTISWGGSVTRNNLISAFSGENTECHFFGLYLLNGNQHVDNHTIADHKMPNCFSNELYKGIIDDKATGVFNGRIMVRPDAQKTNAYQSNNNILLSDDATIYSKPQLEIFADDVKCSHGATSGRINNDEMFYLRSRGISEEDARALLLKAFASDIIDSVKIDSLKSALYKKLESKLSINKN